VASPDDSPAQDDETCRPCRGTGSVISNKGGEASTVECPWCEGSGRRIPEHDAQARFRADAGGESDAGGEAGSADTTAD